MVVVAVDAYRRAQRTYLGEVHYPLQSVSVNWCCVDESVVHAEGLALVVVELHGLMGARGIAHGDYSGLPVNAENPVGHGYGASVERSRRRVLVGEGHITVYRHIASVGAVMVCRERDARSLDRHLHSEVGLVGILPPQVGIVYRAVGEGMVAVIRAVVGRRGRGKGQAVGV